MKKIYLVFFMAISFALVSCSEGGNSNESETDSSEMTTEEETSMTEEENDAPFGDVSGTYVVDAAESTMGWSGSKPLGEHNGTVNITEGDISFENGTITGGQFTFDMTSIVDLDLEDEEQNAKLVGHLKSDDFFNVAEHPTANFKILEMMEDEEGNNVIRGELTIKQITKVIKFPAEVNVDGDMMNAKANFEIDRTKWNVRYGSKTFFDDLGDKFINDEIGITLDLKANKQMAS